MDPKQITITISGCTASGKSTIAALVHNALMELGVLSNIEPTEDGDKAYENWTAKLNSLKENGLSVLIREKQVLRLSLGTVTGRISCEDVVTPCAPIADFLESFVPQETPRTKNSHWPEVTPPLGADAHAHCVRPWIQWGGAFAAPVPQQQRVEIRLRNGRVGKGKVSHLVWNHNKDGGDIIAYRVLEEQPWTNWNGGGRPVSGLTYVEFMWRNGQIDKCRASDLCWDHTFFTPENDIVKYRVVKIEEDPQPKATMPGLLRAVFRAGDLSDT